MDIWHEVQGGIFAMFLSSFAVTESNKKEMEYLVCCFELMNWLLELPFDSPCCRNGCVPCCTDTDTDTKYGYGYWLCGSVN